MHWDAWLERREEVRAQGGALHRRGGRRDRLRRPTPRPASTSIVDLLEQDGPVLSDELEFPTVTLPWIHRGVPRALRARGRGRRAPRVVRGRPGARARRPSRSATSSSRTAAARTSTPSARIKAGRHFVVCGQPVAGRLPGGRAPEPIDALADARATSGCAPATAPASCYVEPGARCAAAAARDGLDERRGPVRLRQPRSMRHPARATRAASWAARRSARSSPSAPPSTTSRRSASTRSPSACSSLNMYLTSGCRTRASRCSRPAASTARGRPSCAVADPPRAAAFLRERGIHVTEKPEGLRISTHFYNNEPDVDACVDALVAYRDQALVSRETFAAPSRASVTMLGHLESFLSPQDPPASSA